MTSFFVKSAIGGNADIARHCEVEKALLNRIEETDCEQAKKAYQRLLNRLRESKAECVSKLGRK